MYAYVHKPFFSPQQDTIVALKALSEFAALMNVEETNIQVTVEGSGSLSPVKFVIDTQNRFLLQTAEVWTRGWLSECVADPFCWWFPFCWLQQRLLPRALSWQEGVPFCGWICWAGGREKGMRTLQRFGKGENMGPVVLGREWIPFELLLFSDPVPDFFVCVILYLLFKPRLRSKYFNPHYTYCKTEAKGI